MRIVGDIPHESCKITLFAWNQKYLIKIEQGPCEQIYKVSELDFNDEKDLMDKITPDFIDRVLVRFQSMHEELAHLLDL